LGGPWLILCWRRGLKREHVGHDAASDLLGEGIVIRRQYAVVQGLREFRDPTGMEVVKRAGVDAFPIMDGHRSNPRKGVDQLYRGERPNAEIAMRKSAHETIGEPEASALRVEQESALHQLCGG
jgi:hypothetical protein